MSNAFYDSARHDFATGAMPWVSGTWKAALLNNSATYNNANTQFSDVSANQIGSSNTLTGNAVSAPGVCSSDSTTFTSISSSLTVKAIVIYIDLGGGVTRLMAWFDTGTGLPLTTTGTNITVDWNATVSHGTVFTVV